MLSATARSLPEYFLLDVRRFLREAAEARKIEKSRTLLTWPYRDALVDISVMCEQAAAKPAHIEQKVWRSSGKAPAMALDAPQIGTPLASGVLGSAPNGVVRLMWARGQWGARSTGSRGCPRHCLLAFAHGLLSRAKSRVASSTLSGLSSKTPRGIAMW